MSRRDPAEAAVLVVATLVTIAITAAAGWALGWLITEVMAHV